MSRAVLLKGPDPLHPQEIAKALAAARGLPLYDTMAEAKRTWGIVGEKLEDAAAKDLVERLAKAGLPALAVPDTLLESPPPVEESRALDLTTFSQGISLLAATVFRESTLKTQTVKEGPSFQQQMLKMGTMLATGIPIQFGGKAKEVKKTIEEADLAFYLELTFAEPARRLRVDGRKFDYGCLGARKGVDSFGNFKQLLLELDGKAAAALRNRGFRALVEGRPVRELGYESLADLERESRWLLTLRALKLLS